MDLRWLTEICQHAAIFVPPHAESRIFQGAVNDIDSQNESEIVGKSRQEQSERLTLNSGQTQLGAKFKVF